MKLVTAMFATIIGFSEASPAQSEPANESARDWAAIAITDIRDMHEQTMRHHPGPHNPLDPDFSERAETALTHALDYARQADSQVGASFAVRAYAAAYRDGHYNVYAPTGVSTVKWPGMIPVRTNGVWRIHALTPELAPLDGTELVSCDSQAPDELMIANLFEFTGNPALRSQWRSLSPYLFLDQSNPFIALPGTCTFSGVDGEVEHSLDWSPIDIEAWNEHATPLRRSENPGFTFTRLEDAGFWISFPTFSPQSNEDNGPSEVDQINQLIADLELQADELRDASHIVIDVRGNRGGASAWGRRIVRAIWGNDYADYRAPAAAEGVDFRVSVENMAHVEWIIEQTVQHEMTEAEVYFPEVLAGMGQAQTDGAPLYREDRPRADPADPAPNPVNARVYFLTDGSCGSACLDFADFMYSLDGVVHIGAETYADSDYMEFRRTELPSGLNRLGLPIKVYRGRARESGESYTPEIAYEAEDWSTAALQDWVATLEAMHD